MAKMTGVDRLMRGGRRRNLVKVVQNGSVLQHGSAGVTANRGSFGKRLRQNAGSFCSMPLVLQHPWSGLSGRGFSRKGAKAQRDRLKAVSKSLSVGTVMCICVYILSWGEFQQLFSAGGEYVDGLEIGD